MKIVKCPICKSEREIKDNVILSVCYCCQVEMVEVRDEKNN